MFPSEPCEICQHFPAQRHHIDGNPLNNSRKNISMLCPKHHVHTDRLELLRKIAYKGGISSVEKCVRDKNGKFSKRS